MCAQGLRARDAVVMLWAWHHFARPLPLDALEALLRCVVAGTGSEAGFGGLDSISTGCANAQGQPQAEHRCAQARRRGARGSLGLHLLKATTRK